MKTTIDIPEPLYKNAKIRAVETGQTLKHLVLTSLIRELEVSTSASAEGKSFLDRRRLLPEYEAARKAGAYRPARDARDVTELISEDRDAR
jgi:hypothetical protein